MLSIALKLDTFVREDAGLPATMAKVEESK